MQPIRHKLLRVLVDNCHRESLEEVYENVNLRYLAYTHRDDGRRPALELPTSISLMWNLQTLIIRGYFRAPMIVVAPVEIWKMRQLRHVICSKMHFPHPHLSNAQDYMENLQTLTAAVNLRLSGEVCKIIPNIKELHLIYDLELQGYDDSLIECLRNLDGLHRLVSLDIKIEGTRWPTPWLFGNTELNKKLTFPTSLEELYLSYCHIGWEDLSKIGSLPHLEALVLEMYAVMVGNKWSPNHGEFRRLKFFKIASCNLIF